MVFIYDFRLKGKEIVIRGDYGNAGGAQWGLWSVRETARFDGTSTDVMRALMVLSDMEWSVAQIAMKIHIFKKQCLVSSGGD